MKFRLMEKVKVKEKSGTIMLCNPDNKFYLVSYDKSTWYGECQWVPENEITKEEKNEQKRDVK